MILAMLLLGCFASRCPEVDSAEWALDEGVGEVRDLPEAPRDLVGARVTVEEPFVVIEYTDAELGPVQVTYRITGTSLHPP
ncbi:MAG: hypothetical protein H6740_27185 [Alphaproteobacteria bacterium]|nr:hypothetical protein [Alphaproteobacteria bacterium]